MSTLVIEHLKAKDLPQQWARELNAGPEQKVTVRIETEQDAATADAGEAFETNDPAFGIWRDRRDIGDVEKYVRSLRAPRYARD